MYLWWVMSNRVGNCNHGLGASARGYTERMRDKNRFAEGAAYLVQPRRLRCISGGAGR